MSYLEGYRQTGAATTRRRAKRDPLAIMHELRSENAQWSKARIITEWKKRAQANDDLTDAVFDYAASNYWTQLQEADRKPRAEPKTREEIAEDRRRTLQIIARAAKTLTLLELVMPNGKKLRDCTFKECGTFGTWFKILATKGKPSEKVGDKFTDEDLKKLC